MRRGVHEKECMRVFGCVCVCVRERERERERRMSQDYVNEGLDQGLNEYL